MPLPSISFVLATVVMLVSVPPIGLTMLGFTVLQLFFVSIDRSVEKRL